MMRLIRFAVFSAIAGYAWTNRDQLMTRARAVMDDLSGPSPHSTSARS